MCELKFVLRIASNKSGSMLAVKLSTRSGQKTGKVSSKMQRRIKTVQISGKLTKVWKVLQMLTHQTKQCLTTIASLPNQIQSQRFHKPLCQGQQTKHCHELIKTSTINLKEDSMHHLLMMKSVLQFKWVSYYLLSKI